MVGIARITFNLGLIWPLQRQNHFQDSAQHPSLVSTGYMLLVLCCYNAIHDVNLRGGCVLLKVSGLTHHGQEDVVENRRPDHGCKKQIKEAQEGVTKKRQLQEYASSDLLPTLESSSYRLTAPTKVMNH